MFLRLSKALAELGLVNRVHGSKTLRKTMATPWVPPLGPSLHNNEVGASGSLLLTTASTHAILGSCWRQLPCRPIQAARQMLQNHTLLPLQLCGQSAASFISYQGSRAARARLRRLLTCRAAATSRLSSGECMRWKACPRELAGTSPGCSLHRCLVSYSPPAPHWPA